MTMRLVECEFCHRLYDFQDMHMCPLCRKTICKNCKHEGRLKAGQCAWKKGCEDRTS